MSRAPIASSTVTGPRWSCSAGPVGGADFATATWGLLNSSRRARASGP